MFKKIISVWDATVMVKVIIRLFVGLAVLISARISMNSSVKYTDSWAFDLTGEEELSAQLRGLWHLGGKYLRTRPVLAPNTIPMMAEVSPFGINTFLEQEVELQKRERQIQIIAEGGFDWIRQEFPWADIEVHGKGDFDDRRSGSSVDAWEKYDHIVGLAEQYDLNIIARLSSAPEWARKQGDVQGTFAPPGSYSDFADYISTLVERYENEITYYQIWNEPNIYPEWGEQSVSPEDYTEMLCVAYRAVKNANTDAVVLAAALAPTVSLSSRDLNDFIYLERMYRAGASECFDIMSVQGYGLWSGPTDHRRRPGVINFARNEYIRDIMVAHNDADKSIWISEMNWNALPYGSDMPATYGQVSLEQQARWVPLGYERASREWPWIGVVNFWYFKRASDAEVNQSWYYFRMSDPDFKLMPVYHSVKDYIDNSNNQGSFD